MRFLIDADLPRSVKSLVQNFGHEVQDVRDIGMAHVWDSHIAKYAQKEQACLLTGDFGFSNIQIYPPEQFHDLVVLELPRDADAHFILGLIRSLLEQPEIIAQLPRRLAIVEAGRVRLRPR